MNKDSVQIDVDLVCRLVADQFPQWADLAVIPVEHDGNDNRSFRLGRTMVVRLPSAEAYTPQVAKEQRWLPRLAPLLPLSIPVPVAMGVPGEDYPWNWSIYRWLNGDSATLESILDLPRFAKTLAQFIAALHQIDPTDGPPPGQHNFFRGGSLATYDAETKGAIATLGDKIDSRAASEIWDTALQSTWRSTPVWLHGDMAASNLLISNGQLSAVIDFGCSGVGDPACEVVILG